VTCLVTNSYDIVLVFFEFESDIYALTIIVNSIM
jgi:hypothetical protein